MTTIQLSEEERRVAIAALEGYSPVPNGTAQQQAMVRRQRQIAVEIVNRIRSTI